MIKLLLPTLAMVLFACTGCASDAPLANAGAPVGTFNSSEYRLGAGDKLRMIVFNEATLSNDYFVSPAGKLTLPLIGEIDAQDKTVTEVRAAVETAYRQGYLRDPSVSLEILTFRPFYILGEVNKPGEYPYTAGLNIQKAVATAQGYTYRANKTQVYIKRPGRPTEERYRVDSATPVLPGDVIRVTERLF